MSRSCCACFAAIALVLVATPPALATDYCVPTVAACPGASGTVAADLPAALTAAAAANNADRIFLAAGTFTAPTTAGFVYSATSGPVEISGAGSSGAGRTTLTTPSAATRVLQLLAGPGSKLSHLEMAIADNGSASTRQAEVRNTAITDVVVSASAPQANTFISLQLDDASSFTGGSVAAPLNLGGNATAVLLNGPGTSMSTSTIVGGTGVASNSSAGSVTLDRLSVTSTSTGINSGGATLNVRDSLVSVSGTACALYSLDQPNTDGVLNADGVTIVGTGGSPRAACASSIFSAPRASTINITNSILRPLKRSTFSNGTGTAAINVTYSDLDSAADVMAGTGPQSLTPAAGQLGATNINVDPLFMSASDFRLGAGSPLIDIGDPATPAGLDLDGNPWLYDGNGDCAARRDMGAYERQTGAQPCPVVPDPTPPAGDSSTPSEGTPPAAGPPPTPSGGAGPPPAIRCVVPRLRGLTRAKAAKLLRGAHCRLGRVKRPHNARGTLVVGRQGVHAKTDLPAGSRVAVTLRRPAPARPPAPRVRPG